MTKKMILKGLNLSLVVAISTLIVVELLQPLFPEYPLVKTYFSELMLSNVLAVIGGAAIIARLILNVVKIEENFWVKKPSHSLSGKFQPVSLECLDFPLLWLFPAVCMEVMNP